MNDLIEKAQNGCRESMSRLIEMHYDRILTIARSLTMPSGMDRDDMVQLALIGFMNGVKKFDPSRGCILWTIAYYQIRNQISKGIYEINKNYKFMLRQSEHLDTPSGEDQYEKSDNKDFLDRLGKQPMTKRQKQIFAELRSGKSRPDIMRTGKYKSRQAIDLHYQAIVRIGKGMLA